MKASQDTAVLFFASLREAMKTPNLNLALENPVQVCELVQLISTQSAAYAAALAGRELLVAVNEQLVTQQCMVTPGDTVALFPPVTGG